MLYNLNLDCEELKFPVTVNTVDGMSFKEVSLNSYDEVIELLDKHVLLNAKYKKSFEDVLWESGLKKYNIKDMYSLYLIKEFNFYESNPSIINSETWFESYNIIKKFIYKPKMSLF